MDKLLGMKGWKTWVAVVLVAVLAANSAGHFLTPEMVEAIIYIAGIFGIVGIGHKIEKASNGGS